MDFGVNWGDHIAWMIVLLMKYPTVCERQMANLDPFAGSSYWKDEIMHFDCWSRPPIVLSIVVEYGLQRAPQVLYSSKTIFSSMARVLLSVG